MNKGFSLKNFNTFHIDSFCKEIHFIHDENELSKFFGWNEHDYLILGGGSNILLSDEIDKVILKNEIKGKEIIHEDEDHVIIRIGAGENWHEFVLWSIQHSFSGIENLSLIPGTIGAAPVQNIGAYGIELEEVFVRLEGFHLPEAKAMNLNKKACLFGYRDSIFKNDLSGKFFITYVHLKLNKKFAPKINYGSIKAQLDLLEIENPTLEQVSQAVCDIRKSKLPDPNVLGNAGSFFKNAIVDKSHFLKLQERFNDIPFYEITPDQFKIPSGWLIEECGWKGRRVGDVSSYEKQALVLVNYGNASGKDILIYAKQIMADVWSKFNIQITPEVNLW